MKQFSIDIVRFVCYNHNDMKYNNKLITNLILFIVTCLLLVSCGGEVIPPVESLPEGSSGSSAGDIPSVPELTVDNAAALVERDKLITEIFICNSLCDKTVSDAIRYPLDGVNEYADFSKIQALLSSTYSASGGEIEFMLSYPQGFEPAVKNESGKTTLFFHAGSGYSDFADVSTLQITDTADGLKKQLKLKSISGNDISLTAVYENGSWLLEKGVYSASTVAELGFDRNFPAYNSGSLSKLSGDILVIELFITDDVSGFTTSQEDEFHQRVQSGVELLLQQTQEYGVTFTPSYERTFFIHENVLGDRVIDFDLMFAETGFGTLEAFAKANCDINKYDGYFLVVCINKPIETSVGVYTAESDTEFYKGERILAGNKTDEYTIYKSILRLLGAYSYDEEIFDKYIESLYRSYFPNDVFLASDINTEQMSPVTAYNCGFTDELNSLYSVFIP